VTTNPSGADVYRSTYAADVDRQHMGTSRVGDGVRAGRYNVLAEKGGLHGGADFEVPAAGYVPVKLSLTPVLGV